MRASPKKDLARVFRAVGLVCLILGLIRLSVRPAGSVLIEAQPRPLVQTEYTDQLIVKLRSPTGGAQQPGMSGDHVRALSTAAGIPLADFRPMSGGAQVLKLPYRMTVAEATAIAQTLSTDPNVEYAEPDRIMRPLLTPNDPRYAEQWHYRESATETAGANLPAAWDITTGLASIVVAVIDTGIRPHADLAGRTVAGFDFISDPFIANDGGGRDADPSDPGDWDLGGECEPGSLPSDSSWHGTHVAGTIGAASNNAAGVAGVNWVSPILPVRVLGKCGGFTSDVVDGMRWAAGLPVAGVPANANPARVLNLSLGGSGSCGVTEQNAINEIVAAGNVVVVAAGNSTVDAADDSPASCDNVITVSAINRAGGRADYSNFGGRVEISAPGGAQSFLNDPNGVLSTLNTGTTVPGVDDYRFYQGTSMAAPHVAGVVSLMLSAQPLLTPSQVLQRLQATARPFPRGTGSDCTIRTIFNVSICGAGIVDAAAAVQAALNPLTADDAGSGEATVPSTGGGGGGCFIATAAFGSPLAQEVQVLREFRNRALLPNAPGRLLVAAYAQVSPPLAELIRQHSALRAVTRGVLWPLVWGARFALAAPTLALALGGSILFGGPLLLVQLRRARKGKP